MVPVFLAGCDFFANNVPPPFLPPPSVFMTPILSDTPDTPSWLSISLLEERFGFLLFSFSSRNPTESLCFFLSPFILAIDGEKA
ncbi:hypothetical protein L1887_25272 [Cichorium endivia]|nr:hypothetical protein L1887_25272 [Cichorium endivia]